MDLVLALASPPCFYEDNPTKNRTQGSGNRRPGIRLSLAAKRGCGNQIPKAFRPRRGNIRNPTNLGWVAASCRAEDDPGRATGNYTISWTGWAQVVDHILDGSIRERDKVAADLVHGDDNCLSPKNGSRSIVFASPSPSPA